MSGFLIARPLDLEPIARTADPITSHLAANALTQSGARAVQKTQVLEGLKRHPYSTSAELAQFLGLSRYITGRRLPDLRYDGKAFNVGTAICSVSNRLALLWHSIGG